LVGPPGQSADAGKQLLEGEGLGQIVISPRVEGSDLTLQAVAGGQHQDRKLGAPGPDPLEDLLAAEARQHNVEQHEVHGLVDRQPHPVLPVVRAQGLVAVSLESTLEESYYTQLVFHDEDAHDLMIYTKYVSGCSEL
jgi:hypothetical protein